MQELNTQTDNWILTNRPQGRDHYVSDHEENYLTYTLTEISCLVTQYIFFIYAEKFF